MREIEAPHARHVLEAFEWHDLSVIKVSLTERGLELVVAPYDQEADREVFRCLRIVEADALSLDITGELSPRDMRSLEVSSFDYAIAPSGRMTGTLGLLPGSAGFWKIAFMNARWSLEDA